MTVTPSDPGSAVAEYNADDWNVGMEDVDASDVIIPRLSIVHAEGLFRNNLTKETFDVLDCVVLGLVKQRIMWAEDVDDGDKPMCKSPDFETGFPNTDTDKTPADKRFPWEKSNFSKDNFQGNLINGHVSLPCDSCVFKEWDKGDWKQPPCSEQHTYAILFNSGSAEEPHWTPALVTFQKTGIKPSKQFISGFAQARQPMFSALTRISLTLQKRGAVTYSVPVLSKIGKTEPTEWRGYADQATTIREFIRQPPRRTDESEDGGGFADDPSRNENLAPAQAAPTAPPAQAAAPTPPPAAPPAQAEAPAPPPAAAPPAQAATPAPAPPAPDDDDLPF